MFGQYSHSQQPTLPKPSVLMPKAGTASLRQNQPIVYRHETRNAPPCIEMLLTKSRKTQSTVFHDPQNVASIGSGSQKRISEYFKEYKRVNSNAPQENTRPTTKHSLKDLQQKYDNIYSQPVNVPPVIPVPHFTNDRESSQRVSYVKKMAAAEFETPPRKRSKPPQKQAAVMAPPKSEPPTSKQEKTSELKVIHLIGFVENVLRWNNMLKNTQTHVVYNVLGTFINVINGTYALEKFVFLRGNNGTVLECSYVEIDRPLPKMVKGQFVACFGRVIGVQRYRIYSIDILNDIDSIDTQRAIFLSQRMTNELSKW